MNENYVSIYALLSLTFYLVFSVEHKGSFVSESTIKVFFKLKYKSAFLWQIYSSLPVKESTTTQLYQGAHRFTLYEHEDHPDFTHTFFPSLSLLLYSMFYTG